MSGNNIVTQSELAERLNITKNQLSVILSEKYNPIKSTVIKLAELLGVSPFEIIQDDQSNLNYMTRNMSLQQLYSIDTKMILPNSGITAVELFAGAGGLALGMALAGIEAKGLIEIDKNACLTLKTNKPEWNIINDDVREVDFSKFKVDVVTGGFPCQAFSYAGKKLGFEDTRGTLFFEFARAIREIRPKLFLAENVRGIISHDNGRTLKTILEILTDLGYNVRYKLVNAVNYGVPQKRERVIIVGTLDGINFSFPDEDKEIRTLRDALPDVPESPGMHYSERRRKVLEHVPAGGCWRDLPSDVQKEFMGKSLFSGGGRTGMARRLSWDEPSLTLTTSPSQKQTERCHPDETRPFTVREYARIQTYPDKWVFAGGIGDQYKQIGNAVPVLLAFRLGQSIISALCDFNSKKIEKDSNQQLELEFSY